MRARPAPLLLAVVFLGACVHVEPPAPKTVDYRSADAQRLSPMMQEAAAGPLRLRSVVYKPGALPLGAFFGKLSRGELKSAFASVHFKYVPSNVDDEALRLLIKRGYVPVFVAVTNAGAAPVDARALRLSLSDASLDLAPIPNEDLPREFAGLDPKALAANTYNVTAVVVGTAVLIGSVLGLCILAGQEHQPFAPGTGPDTTHIGGAGGDGLFGDVFNPVRVDTPVDYNGLLFSPGTLAPGETARGLLFFKARGVDWTGLRLRAALSA